MSDRRGLLIILSSPSGAGKSTLARKLRDWDASLQFSVSATTRAPRVGEIDGKDYFFTNEDKFRSMVNDGEMLEHARVFGNYTARPKGRCKNLSTMAATCCSTSIGRAHSKSAIRR